MKTKYFVAVMIMVVAISLILPFKILPAYAANISITGGTNGAACDSGGYFTPSSATITSGDTITISVPANDPYAGGLEAHGFPQGSFVVARGGSITTNAITANVDYYGTWPSSGCMKGSGTITVSVPTVTPPTPSPTPPSTSPSTTGISSASVPPLATQSPNPTVTNAASATKPTPPSQAITNHSTNNTTPLTVSSNSALKMVAIIGGGALAVIAAILVTVWRMRSWRR